MRKKKNPDDLIQEEIFTYDNKFKNMFENELEKIPEMRKIVVSLNKKMDRCITDGQRENLITEIRILENSISTLEKNEMYTLYLMETSPIIDEYKEILNERCVSSFTGKSDFHKLNKKKKKLLNNFIKVAKKYDKSFILPAKFKINDICDNCKSNNIEMEDERLGNCLDCGAVKEYLININSVREARNTQNESKVHIIDVVQKFQGKQNTHIKDDVYDNIENILKRYNLLNNSDKKSVKFERVSKNDIQMALEELHYTSHYDDCQLIFTNLTGKAGPDLSEIIDNIYDDHEKIVSVYPECVEIVLQTYNNKYVRKSFMSGHYLLFQILTRHGYPCKKEDFNILKSDDPLFFHDKVYEQICLKLGWTGMIYLS